MDSDACFLYFNPEIIHRIDDYCISHAGVSFSIMKIMLKLMIKRKKSIQLIAGIDVTQL